MTDEYTREDKSFQEYLDKVNIQELLVDAGYTLNRRDGLRYPSYIRLDDQGHRIRGDKFIVTANHCCCFNPPSTQKYNVISFITNHPDLFKEHHAGINPYALVHQVCRRLLNMPQEERNDKIILESYKGEPFDITQYDLRHLEKDNYDSQKLFYPYFRERGINLSTQYAFKDSFFLTETTNSKGYTRRNLSFPMFKPTDKDTIVGLEQRGLPYKDKSAFKGMAKNTNASEGMWIASPLGTDLSDTKRVFVFESAYDAMAFYQLMTRRESQLTYKEKNDLRASVYVSTGGTPSPNQIIGLIKAAPDATFHLAFDNDMAGKQFCMNFENMAERFSATPIKTVREEPDPCYKDFNDQLLDRKTLSTQQCNKNTPEQEKQHDEETIQSNVPKRGFHR